MRPRSFETVEVPVPSLPRENGYILVKSSWGLVCGSDISFFTGNKRFRSYPLVAGAPIHECVGEVVESTSGPFQRGDRVLAIPDENRGLAEYFLAPASKTTALTPDIEDPGAACIIQPLATVINAMDRLGDLREKSVAVVGLGSIGMLFCRFVRQGGARSVTGIDPVAARCRKAEKLGATHTICCRSIEIVQRARAVPDAWDPPDICIEAVGHQMETINDCFELVRKDGTILAFGVPDHPIYALEYEMFFRKNAVLMASVTPDWAKYLVKARDLYRKNQKEFSQLVTHRMPVREAEKAFSMYERHEDGIVKAALDLSNW